jgi:hypothetical protein
VFELGQSVRCIARARLRRDVAPASAPPPPLRPVLPARVPKVPSPFQCRSRPETPGTPRPATRHALSRRCPPLLRTAGQTAIVRPHTYRGLPPSVHWSQGRRARVAYIGPSPLPQAPPPPCAPDRPELPPASTVHHSSAGSPRWLAPPIASLALTKARATACNSGRARPSPDGEPPRLAPAATAEHPHRPSPCPIRAPKSHPSSP